MEDEQPILNNQTNTDEEDVSCNHHHVHGIVWCQQAVQVSRPNEEGQDAHQETTITKSEMSMSEKLWAIKRKIHPEHSEPYWVFISVIYLGKERDPVYMQSRVMKESVWYRKRDLDEVESTLVRMKIKYELVPIE